MTCCGKGSQDSLPPGFSLNPPLANVPLVLPPTRFSDNYSRYHGDTRAILLVLQGPQTICKFWESPQYLNELNSSPLAKVVGTEHTGRARTAAFEFVDSTASGPVDIIIASCDGTIHEIVSTIALAPSYKNDSPDIPAQVNLVLVPCETANGEYMHLSGRRNLYP